MKVLEGMKSCLKKIAESYERNPHGPEIIFSKHSMKIGHSDEKLSFLQIEEFLTQPVTACNPLLQCSVVFPQRSVPGQLDHVQLFHTLDSSTTQSSP